MKLLFFAVAVIGFFIGFYFLYKSQLGAIPFFLLSLFFMWLAFFQVKKAMREDKEGCKK
ncbi:hypothetical protein [Cytobacillus purgationiresistens]|uniref:Membrane protein n=1 Tax=Cytobacillus purgationiresistens TaxID=863449 RepID=A0ABU0ADF9_9BACI|nr:hypothetical protein [Cytobacillus purgationiresistens]MDQ0269288.1 putative membrane protein [Cytobacillus purgationiresistens]